MAGFDSLIVGVSSFAVEGPGSPRRIPVAEEKAEFLVVRGIATAIYLYSFKGNWNR